MYSSYSFAPDRQPSHTAAADATGDTGTRVATRTARAFHPEASVTPPAELRGASHDVAVPQADGEP
jgi:hypothetical protein